ncbi:MAG: hypothetical protein Unbinned2990contig1001_5 [Prokaryotic dsDNA virus sp.]|nr:MAG: hypothetical protein Unbinned2990contig1001_5 [Prokaryotic dsDNA virus sp.]
MNINDLPIDLQKQLKKENGISSRNQNLSKDDIRSYAIASLNQLKGIKKSEMIRVLNLAKKMLEV